MLRSSSYGPTCAPRPTYTAELSLDARTAPVDLRSRTTGGSSAHSCSSPEAVRPARVRSSRPTSTREPAMTSSRTTAVSRPQRPPPTVARLTDRLNSPRCCIIPMPVRSRRGRQNAPPRALPVGNAPPAQGRPRRGRSPTLPSTAARACVSTRNGWISATQSS